MSGPSDRRRRWSAAGALLAGLIITLASARAADPEVEALRQRVDELSRSVERLSDQVQSLQSKVEGGTAAGSAATPQARDVPTSAVAPRAASATAATAVVAGANAEIAALRAAWKQVRAGVELERVKDLLGGPTREFTINGKLTWYYIYPGIGAGSVFFNESHRVSSTQTPPLGFGW